MFEGLILSDELPELLLVSVFELSGVGIDLGKDLISV